MKKLFLVILVLFSLSTLAQENNNFKIKDGGLIWQKIYSSSLSSQDIITTIKRSGKINQIDFNGNMLTGNIENLHIDNKSIGYKKAPIYVKNNTLSGSVVIDFKDNRYRVTISNIVLKVSLDNTISKPGESYTLDYYALKKSNNEFKNKFLNSSSTIYNAVFNKIFDVKELKDEDTW